MRKRARSKVSKAANKVTKAVGAAPLADFLGTKLAKRRAPKGQKKLIKQTTTGKQAARSAAALGFTLGSIATGGAAVGAIRASKAAKAARAVRGPKIKRIPTQFQRNTIPGTISKLKKKR